MQYDIAPCSLVHAVVWRIVGDVKLIVPFIYTPTSVERFALH